MGASSFPTVIAFVIDTLRCQSPHTFISNMLQACSILYKTRLPLVLVFNKCDVLGYEFVVDWLDDFNKFQEALANEDNYTASLSRSLSMVLEEFYKNLTHVGISAVTGLNIDKFFDVIKVAREEYLKYYLPDLQTAKKDKIVIQEKKA